ncbi:hypothetical protein [Aurantiacibacter luteus]|nr:hypothetical protein [Aurantiacibacter luteus]
MTTPVEVMGIRVADRLATAENLANQTLRAFAALQQSMMDVRTDSDVAPYEGQIAVMRVQAAAGKIVEAQSELFKAHKSLRADFCRITMLPDSNSDCPAWPGVATEAVAA